MSNKKKIKPQPHKPMVAGVNVRQAIRQTMVKEQQDRQRQQFLEQRKKEVLADEQASYASYRTRDSFIPHSERVRRVQEFIQRREILGVYSIGITELLPIVGMADYAIYRGLITEANPDYLPEDDYGWVYVSKTRVLQLIAERKSV